MTVEKPLFIRICKLSYVALHCRKNYIAGTTVYVLLFALRYIRMCKSDTENIVTLFGVNALTRH